jgi:hypothetical protein
MFDVMFLTCDEPNAEDNFRMLRQAAPWAQKVANCNSIHQAHQTAAQRSRTHWFFTVDGDNLIVNPTLFFGNPPWTESWHSRAVGVFLANNPTNNLQYGWGGIKLWNQKLLADAPQHYVDFTTAFPMYVIDVLGSTHVYNTSEWNTWRTVLREVFKLLQKTDPQSQMRLQEWHQPHAAFAFREAYLHALNTASALPPDYNVNCWQTLKHTYEQLYLKREKPPDC